MRYKDEKYVEALEEELEALRKQVGARRTEVAQVMGGRRWSKTAAQELGLASSAAQAEEMYRRARTEVAAEAGAGYGRVSLEALYLLPAEFTNAYQRLFLQALRESPGRTGEPNPPAKRPARLLRRGEPNQRVVVRDEDGEVVGHAEEEVLDRDPDRGGGKARAGGRRHRDHWVVKDERALRTKTAIDRELKGLAAEILEGLKPRAAENGGPTAADSDSGATQCTQCRRFLKSSWRHCPNCGAARSAGR